MFVPKITTNNEDFHSINFFFEIKTDIIKYEVSSISY